jgi:hypothetical protein
MTYCIPRRPTVNGELKAVNGYSNWKTVHRSEFTVGG